MFAESSPNDLGLGGTQSNLSLGEEHLLSANNEQSIPESTLYWEASPRPDELEQHSLGRIRKLLIDETGETYSLNALRKLPAGPGAGSLILTDNQGEINGILWVMVIDEKTVRILSFCVAKKLQNRGLGGDAWGKFCNIAKKNGYYSVYLEVKRSNYGGQKFYRKRGLEEVGRLSNYYQKGIGILMSGPL